MASTIRYAAGLAVLLLGASGCGGGDLSIPGEVGPPADLLKVSGDSQQTAVGTQVPDSLVVRLVDADGIGVPEGAVSWVVGTGGGSITPGTGQTSADGLSGAKWVLGPEPGANTVTAVVAGLPIVVFSASGTGNGGNGGGGGDGGGDGGGGVARLVFLVQPTDTEKDEKIRPAVVVGIVDEDGLAPELSAKIHIELAGGSAEMKGKTAVDTRNGFAVFDDLEIKNAGTFTLRASAPEEPELGSVESGTFQVEED